MLHGHSCGRRRRPLSILLNESCLCKRDPGSFLEVPRTSKASCRLRAVLHSACTALTAAGRKSGHSAIPALCPRADGVRGRLLPALHTAIQRLAVVAAWSPVRQKSLRVAAQRPRPHPPAPPLPTPKRCCSPALPRLTLLNMMLRARLAHASIRLRRLARRRLRRLARRRLCRPARRSAELRSQRSFLGPICSSSWCVNTFEHPGITVMFTCPCSLADPLAAASGSCCGQIIVGVSAGAGWHGGLSPLVWVLSQPNWWCTFLQVRWALGNASEDGAANFGLPMRIEPFRNSKDDDWGCAAAQRCAQVGAGCVPAALQTS